MNLTDFLPAVDHTRVDRDMEPSLDNSGKLLFRTKHIRKSLDNIAMWQSAWNNYEYLLVLSDSSRYAEMNKDRDFIQKFPDISSGTQSMPTTAGFEPRQPIAIAISRQPTQTYTRRYSTSPRYGAMSGHAADANPQNI